MKKILLFVLMLLIFTIPVQAMSEMTLFQLEITTSEKSIIQKYEYTGGNEINGTYESTSFKDNKGNVSISGWTSIETFEKMENVIAKYNVDEWFNLESENVDYDKDVFHLKICTDRCREITSNQIPESLELLSKELRDLTLKEGFLNGAKVILFIVGVFALIFIVIIIKVILYIVAKYTLSKKRLNKNSEDEDNDIY